jgi:hypothetical protein
MEAGFWQPFSVTTSGAFVSDAQRAGMQVLKRIIPPQEAGGGADPS